MNILHDILEHKRLEIEFWKRRIPVHALEQEEHFSTRVKSLSHTVNDSYSSGIIAEVKRMSPSAGTINTDITVSHVAKAYEDAGAAAVSIVTEKKYFGGDHRDLIFARKAVSCPVLRKDFIIDEYQILDSKALGADAILLIAAILTPKQVKRFAVLAKSIGLEVLLEVHSAAELYANREAQVDLIGINNRNLNTGVVDTSISKKASKLIPNHIVKISESGFKSAADVIELKQYGYKGFLIGETFMQHQNPGTACQEFITSLRKINPIVMNLSV